MFRQAVIYKDEIVNIAGYGEMTIEEIADRILSADLNRKYLTDCLAEEIAKLKDKNG
jgi:hypothetical protein